MVVVFAVAFGLCVVASVGWRGSFGIDAYDFVVVNDCIGRLMSGDSVVVLVRACSTSSRIIITPLSMCGFRVVVNDVIYSRFDFGLVLVGAALAVCWTFDCLLLSMSALNENGSVSVLSSMESDSLLVTSFDDGCA